VGTADRFRAVLKFGFTFGELPRSKINFFHLYPSKGEEMNDNMSAPMATPEAPKKNNTPLIIGAVVVVVLCCCCVFVAVAYQYGDQILKALQ
jgi:hypothetical protein